MADEPDLVDVLVADHDELRRLLDTILAAPSDAGDHLAVTIAELVRHLVVEEDYLYPAVREVLPDGGPLADEALAQSAKAERWAKQLEELTIDEVDRAILLRHFSDSVLRHMRMTETELFPRLRQHYTPSQLRFLAGQVEMAKRTAPTRPHPHAPKTPPWNQILTPGIGLVDRIRDAMTGRASRPDQL